MNKPFTKIQIEKILSSKIEEWLSTLPLSNSKVDDSTKSMKQIINDHYIITGGAIVSLLLGEEPNDYDIYFDNVHVCHEVAAHYCNVLNFNIQDKIITSPIQNWNINNKIRQTIPGSIEITLQENYLQISETPEENESKKYYKHLLYYGNNITKKKGNRSGLYTPEIITNNSISLTDDIQIVTRIIGSPMDIHKTFDFVHCVSYFTPETGLVLNKFALESILTRELYYMGSPFPICSLFRMKKFIERGWTIKQEEILKIVIDIMKLPLNVQTLNVQLQNGNGLNSYWNDFISNLPTDIDLKDLERKDFFALIDNK